MSKSGSGFGSNRAARWFNDPAQKQKGFWLCGKEIMITHMLICSIVQNPHAHTLTKHSRELSVTTLLSFYWMHVMIWLCSQFPAKFSYWLIYLYSLLRYNRAASGPGLSLETVTSALHFKTSFSAIYTSLRMNLNHLRKKTTEEKNSLKTTTKVRACDRMQKCLNQLKYSFWI